MEITHDQVIAAMQQMKAAAGQNTAQLEETATAVLSLADGLVQTAEAIGKYGVSPRTQAEMNDLALLCRVARGLAVAVQAHGLDVQSLAAAGVDTAWREHGGIKDAHAASPDATAAGSWHTQE
jgi:hypothetical protein